MNRESPVGKSALTGIFGDPFSPIVEVNGRIFLQSLLAADAGEAAAQVSAILDKATALLETLGASISDVRKLVVAMIDGADRRAVLASLNEHFPSGLPCYTALVVTGLSDPEARIQIDIDAVRESSGDEQVSFLHNEGMITASRSGDEIFLSAIDGVSDDTINRGLADAAAQADLAMVRLSEALDSVGACFEDVCKITVHVPDRYYREAVYPEIGRRLGTIYPVSTGLVVQGLSRPEALFSIDALVEAGNGRKHKRERKYHTSTTLYGQMKQKLDCGFCMSIRANDRVFLRGQTGMDLSGVLHERADVVAQNEQAMQNVIALLADAGANLQDVVKATLFVTDPAFLEPCRSVIARYLKDSRPAFSCMVVKGLAAPDLLMEVDILAVRKGP